MNAGVFSNIALFLPMDQFYSGFDLATGRLLVLGGIGYWFYLGMMIFCIAALVNLESVFAGIRGPEMAAVAKVSAFVIHDLKNVATPSR